MGKSKLDPDEQKKRGHWCLSSLQPIEKCAVASLYVISQDFPPHVQGPSNGILNVAQASQSPFVLPLCLFLLLFLTPGCLCFSPPFYPFRLQCSPSLFIKVMDTSRFHSNLWCFLFWIFADVVLSNWNKPPFSPPPFSMLSHFAGTFL